MPIKTNARSFTGLLWLLNSMQYMELIPFYPQPLMKNIRGRHQFTSPNNHSRDEELLKILQSCPVVISRGN